MLGSPDTEEVEVIGITLTKEGPLRELRAACKFFGISQSGSKLTCFQRVVSHLKEAAAEVAANARKEVSREARGQAIVPVPTEEEQQKHALIHTPFAPWCDSCLLHSARQDRHLRTGAARMPGIPVISLIFAAPRQALSIEEIQEILIEEEGEEAEEKGEPSGEKGLKGQCG